MSSVVGAFLIEAVGDSYFALILISAILHCVLFYVIPEATVATGNTFQEKSKRSPAQMEREDRLMNRSCFVSTIHALVCISYVCIWAWKYNVEFGNTDRMVFGTGQGDEYQKYMLIYSMGYFLYDGIMMMIYPSLAATTSIIHHVVISAAISLGVFYGGIAVPFHFFLYLEELSTPFLNFKGYFRHSNPSLSKIFAALFALSFFLSRTIYGSVLYGYGFFVAYSIWNSLTLNQSYQVAMQMTIFSASHILNVYWLVLIVKKMKSK